MVEDGGAGWPGVEHDTPNSSVVVSIPDGTSGWFIGGSFTTIGGHNRNGLARLHVNGSLDLSWAPEGVHGTIHGMTIENGVLYVGGSFDEAEGEARSNLAAYDITTQQLLDWCSSSGTDGPVLSLSAGDALVFIGGDFTSAGGQNRSDVAAIDQDIGNAIPWVGGLSSGAIYTTEYRDGLLYVGGDFSFVNGVGRANIASLFGTTGEPTSWNPNAGGAVHAIALSGDTAFVGGSFNFVGGSTRRGVAALLLSSDFNNALAWDAGITDQGWVSSIVVTPDIVYLGGDFTRIGNPNVWRYDAAALDRTTGAANAWDPSTYGWHVLTLARLGSFMYIGGGFTDVGVRRHDKLAAFDMISGKPLPWRGSGYSILGTPEVVMTLAQKGDTLFLAGGFSQVDGVGRNNIAAVSKSTGELLTWQANVDGRVNSILRVGNVLYIGGQFSTVNGVARQRLAALNATTGSLISAWQANVVGNGLVIEDLHFDGTRIFACGSFSSVNGIPRQSLVALDPGSGAVQSFAASIGPSATVHCAETAGDTLFISGTFVTVNGSYHKRVAALRISTAEVLANWNCNAEGPIIGNVAVDRGVLFVSGPDSLNGHFVGRLGVTSSSYPEIPPPWVATINFVNNSRLGLRSYDMLFCFGGLYAVDDVQRNLLAAWSVPTGFESWINNPSTGEVEVLPRGFNVCPNPSDREFLVEVEGPDIIRGVRVFHGSGRIVFDLREVGSSNLVTVQLGRAARGEYLCEVLLGTGRRIVRKIILE
ncbi:MAG: delta-60 repeat domain-containing protein [Flavobacteriales bacterium]|nr:delta-60 repeat domain-containing protein [Flavobacteriales bacterium]